MTSTVLTGLPRAPADPRALTAEWLTGVLHAAGALGKARVLSPGLQPVGPGKGMAGRVVRLRPAYDLEEPGAPRRLIAKFPPEPGPTRTLADRLHLQEREYGSYTELAGRLGVPVPRLYAAAAGDGGYVLLLEDVGPAREGDLLRGCSLDEAWSVVAQLACMHAAWWQSPDLEKLAWLPSPNSREVIDLMARRGRAAWAEFRRRFGAHMPGPILKLGAALSCDRSVLDRLARPPFTLVHGDMRINNVLFAPEPPPCPLAFIDWQTVIQGRGPMDLATLFVSSLQPEDRRAAEADLIPRYHALLVEKGVRDYSLEECRLDYRLAVVNQFAQVVVLSSLLKVEERLEDGVGAVTGGRLMAALLDLDGMDLVPSPPSTARRLTRWLLASTPLTDR